MQFDLFEAHTESSRRVSGYTQADQKDIHSISTQEECVRTTTTHTALVQALDHNKQASLCSDHLQKPLPQRIALKHY